MTREKGKRLGMVHGMNGLVGCMMRLKKIRSGGIYKEKKRMQELKPCPFCKSTYLGCRMRVNPDDYLYRYEAFIFCHMCGAEGKKAKYEHEMPEEIQISVAVDCWNERYIDETEQI